MSLVREKSCEQASRNGEPSEGKAARDEARELGLGETMQVLEGYYDFDFWLSPETSGNHSKVISLERR